MRRMIACAALQVVALAATSSDARAQVCACENGTPAPRWSIFVSTGAALMDVASSNAHLTPLGYPALSRDAVGFGGGGYVSFSELRLGVEHVRLDAGEESSAGGRAARLTSSYTVITAGWDLMPAARISIVPTFGVGRGSYVVTVGDRAGGAGPALAPPPTFDEIATDPGRASRISGAQWIFEPSIAADLLVLQSSSHRLGITLGARVGYRVAPNRPEWEYRGERASGGPVDQAKGPIVRIMLGIGGR